MAIFHLSIKIISRGGGKSAVAASAYRAGEKLTETETGYVHDYTKKNGVIHTEVFLSANAPPEYASREILWNEVQKIEKQADAQLAREIEVALPVELSREEQIELVRKYVLSNFVSVGMCADVAIHEKKVDGKRVLHQNPHAHILLTTRAFKDDGTWAQKEKKAYALDENGERIPLIDPATGLQKLGKRNEKMWKRVTVLANDWNDQSNAEKWRQSWADMCNLYLPEEQMIDHRSFERQGLEQIPTIHEGYVATATVASNATAEVKWYLGDTEVTGNAGFNKAYTVKVTLTANEGYAFTNSTSVALNGNAVTATKNADGTLTVSHTFDATGMGTINYSVYY